MVSEFSSHCFICGASVDITYPPVTCSTFYWWGWVWGLPALQGWGHQCRCRLPTARVSEERSGTISHHTVLLQPAATQVNQPMNISCSVTVTLDAILRYLDAVAVRTVMPSLKQMQHLNTPRWKHDATNALSVSHWCAHNTAVYWNLTWREASPSKMARKSWLDRMPASTFASSYTLRAFTCKDTNPVSYTAWPEI